MIEGNYIWSRDLTQPDPASLVGRHRSSVSLGSLCNSAMLLAGHHLALHSSGTSI